MAMNIPPVLTSGRQYSRSTGSEATARAAAHRTLPEPSDLRRLGPMWTALAPSSRVRRLRHQGTYALFKRVHENSLKPGKRYFEDSRKTAPVPTSTRFLLPYMTVCRESTKCFRIISLSSVMAVRFIFRSIQAAVLYTKKCLTMFSSISAPNSAAPAFR